MAITVFYDGNCPFCSNYVGFLRLKAAAGEARLVDLRKDCDARSSLQSAGFDLDRGMVAEIDGIRYAGSDAINILSLMSSRVGVFNRLAALAFSSAAVSRAVYPVMRAGRMLTLDLLGRNSIAEQDEAVDAKFTLFSLTLGIFTILHVLIYTFKYGYFPPRADMILLLLAGAALTTRPGSKPLFLAVAALALASGWIEAPTFSNHTMLLNVTMIGFAVTYCAHLLRGSNWNRTFVDFSAVGGAGLLVMYFFGVFHKINAGFLDPETSCAVILWRAMPPPLVYLQYDWVHYVAIYSTFVIEGLVMLALLWRPSRHIGIFVGILFHLLLALSNFAMYLPFTMLAITLHVLFLSPEAALRVMRSPIMVPYLVRLRQPLWQVVGLCYIAAVALLAIKRDFTMATVLASLFVLPVCFAILLYGRAPRTTADAAHLPSRGGYAIAASIGGVFFLLCLAPYFGLRNSQSINMFANLRTEGGVSNHLVFRKPLDVFPFLQRMALVTEASHSRFLEALAGTGQGLVYYSLLQKLRDNPAAVVTYEIDGVRHANQSAATLAGEMKSTLYPAVFDKFLNFNIVQPGMTPRCY